MKLPEEFENRMKKILGAEEYTAFCSAMDTPPVRSLRVNTLKCSAEDFEELCDFNTEKLSFSDVGYIFECDRIGAHPLHHSGAVYVQEPAAMAAVSAAEIAPGMKILDMCASPGGKSTQAAAGLCGNGIIVSNEIDKKRCGVLLSNLERIGVVNYVVTNTDSAALADTYPEFFDLVVVDAPCSGEGMMRKNPLAVSEWSMENIELCVRRQREILQNAARTVKKGGRLLYSTCTFAPEENEGQISDFLCEHPDFYPIPVKDEVRRVTSDGLTSFEGKNFGENMTLGRRFYPHVSRGEGQFMILLEREGEENDLPSDETKTKGRKKKQKSAGRALASARDIDTVRDFLSDTLTEEGLEVADKYKLVSLGDTYYLSPDIPMPEGSALKCPGVPVGDVQKGRVIPHHNFFMAYGRYFKEKIELGADDERVAKYFHGESIMCGNAKGFAAVLYCGVPMGGAKVSSGEAKNYYPKGLRI